MKSSISSSVCSFMSKYSVWYSFAASGSSGFTLTLVLNTYSSVLVFGIKSIIFDVSGPCSVFEKSTTSILPSEMSVFLSSSARCIGFVFSPTLCCFLFASFKDSYSVKQIS